MFESHFKVLIIIRMQQTIKAWGKSQGRLSEKLFLVLFKLYT